MELLVELALPILYMALGYEVAKIVGRRRGRSALANDASIIAKARKEKR